MGILNQFLGYLGLGEERYEEEVPMQEEEQEMIHHASKRNRNNVVSLQHAKEQTQLVLFEPRSFDEAQDLADHLKNRRAVVVNLQRLHPEHAKRIVDFLSGTVYALNGDIQKVGADIFVCVPDNVDIQGSISEMFYQEQES